MYFFTSLNFYLRLFVILIIYLDYSLVQVHIMVSNYYFWRFPLVILLYSYIIFNYSLLSLIGDEPLVYLSFFLIPFYLSIQFSLSHIYLLVVWKISSVLLDLFSLLFRIKLHLLISFKMNLFILYFSKSIRDYLFLLLK